MKDVVCTKDFCEIKNMREQTGRGLFNSEPSFSLSVGARSSMAKHKRRSRKRKNQFGAGAKRVRRKGVTKRVVKKTKAKRRKRKSKKNN